MLRLGAHESIAGGLHRAVERGLKAGCESLQIWTKNSRQWDAPPLDDTAITLFREAVNDVGLRPVVAHAAYLINIASPDLQLNRRSVASLIQELERCEALEIPYLILHPGAHTGAGTDNGLAQAVRGLSEVHTALPGYRARILLETTAGQGTTLGGTFEELAHLLDRTQGGERLGICLDTCHVFAAGYDVRTVEGYEGMMAALDHAIGLERLAVIHLNDSQQPLGSRRDRHEHIGDGHLGAAAFARLLRDQRLDGLTGILETPKSEDLCEDRENLARLRSMVAPGAALDGWTDRIADLCGSQ